MQRLRDLWYRFKAFDRRHQIAIVLCLVAALGASITYAYIQISGRNIKENPDPTIEQKTEPPKPLTKAAPLTGAQVAPELADRPITGIMIENSPDARPQSGLSQAGIVFEAVAEGGITRFLALYGENRPGTIGPVRSLRPYYLDWAMGFDASIVHVGGSADALQLAVSRNSKDLDQMGNGKYFWRSDDRVAPHNVYTSMDMLDSLKQERGHIKSAFDPLPFKADSPAAVVTAGKIDLDFSGPLYAASFTYSGSSNDYGRWLAGEAHIDRETGQQLRAKNVVVMKMPTTYDGSYAVMPTLGQGEVLVFRDGTVETGLWSQESYSKRVRFLKHDGSEIALNTGNTWVAVTPDHRPFSYAAQ